MPRWRRCSPSARVGCGPRPKRARSGTAASGWWNGRRGFRGRRFSAGCARSRARRRCRPDAAGGSGADGNRPPSSMRRCCAISMRWSSPPRPAIRTRRWGGPARVPGRWPSRCRPSATPSAIPSSPTCCTNGATPSKLQRLANRTGLAITVCHFPPGTSKWNKIEHRLFSHIAMNWRGKPLVSLAAIVSLIASTHHRSGLRVRSVIDRRHYADGVTVTDAQMATVHLERHAFHGDWNYTISPASRRRHH
jgi:hypothetical protein